MTDIQHDFSSDWCATPELGAQNDHPPASNYCNLAIILAKAWFMACLLVFWEATADLIVWAHFWRPESWRGELRGWTGARGTSLRAVQDGYSVLRAQGWHTSLS